jgi:biotin transport system substrate-specific component
MNRNLGIVLAGLFAALTAVGAFIRVPVPFVPFTLQFMFVVFAGLMLGSRYGALSQAIYVALGLAGLPVFTGGGGIGYVLKPSFGYLIGFILAAYVIGKIAERSEKLTIMTAALSCAAGMAVIYAVGVPYMYGVLNLYLGKGVSAMAALKMGCITFLPADILKSILASIVAVKVVPVVKPMISSSSRRSGGIGI